MDTIRRSIQGLTDKVRTFFGPGENNESPDESDHSGNSGESSNSEIVECSSDCSFCATENRSISMHPSVSSSKRSIEGPKTICEGVNENQRESISYPTKGVKRFKSDCVEEAKRREADDNEIIDLSSNNKINIPGGSLAESDSSESNKENE